MSRQRFTPEFKEEAIKLVTQKGYSAADVSERLGVSQHSIYKWVKAAKPLTNDQYDGQLIEAKKEILHLKGQLRQAEALLQRSNNLHFSYFH